MSPAPAPGPDPQTAIDSPTAADPPAGGGPAVDRVAAPVDIPPQRRPAPADRFDPAHYEPERVPPEVAAGRRAADTLGAGRPGKIGLLELAYARVDGRGGDGGALPRGGRTELVRRYQKSPLQIMRPLYVDPALPGVPVTYLMSTGGGIVQADRLRTDVSCGPGAHAVLTTQAATKVHRCDFGHATQLVNIEAGPHACVEYLPDPLIPFAEARFYQRTRIAADPTATVFATEAVTAGRLARGELHAYTALASDLEITGAGGELLAADTLRLAPAAGRVDGPAVFAGHDLMASFWAVTPEVPAAELADALHEALRTCGVAHGVSTLPDECGAWVRLLGDEPPAMERALRTAWDAARRLVLGVPAPDLRKN